MEIWIVRLFCLAMIAYGVIAWRRVRAKPTDWRPPYWETWHYYGEVDRDRHQLNAGCSMLAGIVLLAVTFLAPLFIELVRSRSN